MGAARLRTHIFPYSIAITLIALVGVTAYAVLAIRDLHLQQSEDGLLEKAHLLDALLTSPLGEDTETLQSQVRELGSSVRTRITVVSLAGRVLADSDEEPAVMGNHADRPEIRRALADGVGEARRYSQTLDRDMLYVAVTIPRNGPSPLGVVRTAVPLRTLADTARATLESVAMVGLVAGLLAAWMALVVARRVTRPLEELTQGAQAFAAGSLERRLRVAGAREVGDLAQAMNEMAEQLGERIVTIDRQRDELGAVLEAMVEGVVAVDTEEHVLRVNSACLGLLGLHRDHTEGRTLQELLRNPKLDQLVAEVLSTGDPREGEIQLRRDDGLRTLEVHGSVLQDPEGTLRGAVLVLHDVTRMRRLERVRRDFVANVSHELRTPVTAIKGSVETLQEGARGDAEATARFLGIAGAEAERLAALLEDLLALSHIEQDEGPGLEVETLSMRAVVQEALDACEASAQEKGVSLVLSEARDVEVPVHRTLFVQALVNLVDNAIKYSEAGTCATLSMERDEDEALVHVVDQGPGIAATHLPRVFERFYRVDKGRSRALGGTGLGLAIVKHIALAHKGRVDVESAPGAGSRFTIRVPLHRNEAS